MLQGSTERQSRGLNEILDDVLTEVNRDITDTNEFVGQNDFVSLLPSKMLEVLMRDSDSDSD